MNIEDMRKVIELVSVPEFEFRIHEERPAATAPAIYLQGHYTEADITSGISEPQSTRKWPLSQHMTKSELVQTAFKCYLTSLEHQAREAFLYRGRRIFGPHFDVDALHSICTDRHLDYRREVPQMTEQLRDGDVLIVVDVQNDFVTGSLAVKDAPLILPAVEAAVDMFFRSRLPIFVSKDWHPADHSSFKEQGGPWPAHCVQNTAGAELAFRRPVNAVTVYKGGGFDDAYSAFEGIAGQRITLAQCIEPFAKRLFVCGIATDYCVKATVMDARKLEYPVVLIVDAIAAVTPEGSLSATNEMYDAGVIARITKYMQPVGVKP